MPTPCIEYALAGGLREDYFITPRGTVHQRQLGGNAVYAAVGARLWSDRVGLAARVGRNYPAAWLPVIAARGIDTRGVTILPADLDTRTFYAYLSLEERVDTDPPAHFARVGQPLPAALDGYTTSTEGQDSPEAYSALGVRPGDLPAAYLAARGFHLAPFDFAMHRHLPPHLRQHGVRWITCDPSVRYMAPRFAEALRAMLADLDAFLPSEMEARLYFGPQLADRWEAAEGFAALGAACVVIKLGAEGQYVYSRAAGRRWHVPAYPARVQDVTGAGDAYCGGFLVGLAQTGDPVEAALHGAVSASLVVEGIGALFALDQPAGEAAQRLQALRPQVRRV